MHQNYSANPVIIFQSLWKHRLLIWQMSKREVIGRYRGSLLGLLWSIIHPLLMLAVYTLVFGIILPARWGVEVGSTTNFAIFLFAGISLYSLFAECVNQAPALILRNVNFVKKVVFPLEILPWVSMGSALFHALINLTVLLLFYLIANHSIHWTVVFLPLIILPFILLTMGLSWFLASLGVFLRDIGQTVGIFTSALLFLSAIFFPLSALPEPYRTYLLLNPLAFIIEQARYVLIWGKVPDWWGLGIFSVFSLVVAWLGLLWFQKTRKGFADVL
jgi:lipopolysaccharide transport system permease protein